MGKKSHHYAFRLNGPLLTIVLFDLIVSVIRRNVRNPYRSLNWPMNVTVKNNIALADSNDTIDRVFFRFGK